MGIWYTPDCLQHEHRGLQRCAILEFHIHCLRLRECCLRCFATEKPQETDSEPRREVGDVKPQKRFPSHFSIEESSRRRKHCNRRQHQRFVDGNCNILDAGRGVRQVHSRAGRGNKRPVPSDAHHCNRHRVHRSTGLADKERGSASNQNAVAHHHHNWPGEDVDEMPGDGRRRKHADKMAFDCKGCVCERQICVCHRDGRYGHERDHTAVGHRLYAQKFIHIQQPIQLHSLSLHSSSLFNPPMAHCSRLHRHTSEWKQDDSPSECTSLPAALCTPHAHRTDLFAYTHTPDTDTHRHTDACTWRCSEAHG
eukprot:m.281897 g.281897  ORF g.281897 m.281897 type:complete len:309 (+) comp19842_c0_seq21:193-1119(+)